MLSRHKKKGFEGFKYFACFLETLSLRKRKDIIESAILEDPVYMTWIFKNMITLDYLLHFDSKEVETFFSNAPNLLEVLAKAVLTHPLKDKILAEFLPTQMKKEIEEIFEIFKNIPTGAQQSSQYFLVSRIRKLQDEGAIREFSWKLPPRSIATESTHHIRSGDFILKYESGKIALEGQLDHTLRSGAWQHYYSNGQLMAEGEYQRGEKKGEWIFHYANGVIKSQGTFVEDRKSGEWKEWDTKGNEKIVTYSKGKVVGP